MTTTSSLHSDLLDLITFLKQFPEELQCEAVQRIKPIADELDTKWRDLQFASTPLRSLTGWWQK